MKVNDWLLGRAVDALLTWKSRPGAIRSALAGRRYERVPPPAHDRVTLAVVQMKIDLVDDGVQFAMKYYDLVNHAVSLGAQLVVFPEYAWLPMLGLLPPVRELAKKGVKLQGAVDELAPGGGLTIEGVFRTMAPAVRRIFETTAGELARRFGIYLMPGSAVTVDKAVHLFNTAFLYGPDGTLMGKQNKLHPTDMEVDWMTPGNELRVFATPFARIAMPVCMDYTFWETTRAAVLDGAEVLLGFSAEAKANEFYLALRGVPTRIQESTAYGCGAFCITRLFGLDFCGPSYIAAPLGMCGQATPFLARADAPDREQVIAAELDLGRLREFRAQRLQDWNPRLYARYLPQSYQAYRSRVTQDGKRMIGSRDLE